MKNSTALPTTYQEFIALSRYSRFRPDLGRRETWEETVDRWACFWAKRLPQVPAETMDTLREAVLNLEVMPSMRTLMTAGPALERDEMAGFNCSSAAITTVGPTVELWDDSLKDIGHEEPIKITLKTPIVFDELFYILLCGTGVGFSVERQFTNEMPTVGKKLSRTIYAKNNKNFPGVAKAELSSFDKKSNTIIVSDSKYGWASALRILLVELYNGNFSINWDVSSVRAAGEPLKTFGGRASGSKALVEMFEYAVRLLKVANGRKLSSIECHDLMCAIAQAVVVGGTRRSALISLSNLSDERMRYAKSGEWWNTEPQRALANNAVAYTEKPTVGAFMREWQALYESKSGERGIFNREAAKKACLASGRSTLYEYLVNPCGESVMRHNGGLCNLSEVVVRPEDTLEDLVRKVKIAAFIGTMQSTLTKFVYVNPQWRKNAEEERLLGVSITGATDHPVLKEVSEKSRAWLQELRKWVEDCNAETAKLLGINTSSALTLNKPSGTVSQLVNSSSGLHARYSPYYVRRVRADGKDPLALVMQEQGYPCEPDVTQPSNLVFSFPVKSPEGAVFRDDRTAIEQLEYWMMWKKDWCRSHNPSITVYVKEHEWLEVGAWVYKNFDEICGLSFLPHSDHVYRQAPYTECTKDEYEELLAKMPIGIDHVALSKLETTDQTTGSQEYACTGGACELI